MLLRGLGKRCSISSFTTDAVNSFQVQSSFRRTSRIPWNWWTIFPSSNY